MDHSFTWWWNLYIPNRGLTDTSSSFTTLRIAVIFVDNQKLQILYGSPQFYRGFQFFQTNYLQNVKSYMLHEVYPRLFRDCVQPYCWLDLARSMIKTTCKFSKELLCQKFLESFKALKLKSTQYSSQKCLVSILDSDILSTIFDFCIGCWRMES
jgi:hypothetical protein